MVKFWKINIVLLISLLACKSNPLCVDVSDIDVNVEIEPFFEKLFTADTSDIKLLASKFYHEYGNYWEIYNMGVINTGDPSLDDFPFFLAKFLSNEQVRELVDSCVQRFSDYSKEEKELESAFKHLKYYYPKKNIPKIFFHVSGFNQSVVTDSGFISVSIDNYLGENSRYYEAMMTPLYLRKKMCKDRIVKDILLAYGLSEFHFKPKTANLISNILYQAKIRYFVKAMIPHLSDADIMGYTQEQARWCKENEDMIWEFLIYNKYLFSTDYKTIVKYINDGPFTSGMPKESPGQAVIWLGLQILEDYIKENNCSLIELMMENDYNQILRKSGYQP